VTGVAAETSHANFLCQQLCAVFFSSRTCRIAPTFDLALRDAEKENAAVSREPANKRVSAIIFGCAHDSRCRIAAHPRRLDARDALAASRTQRVFKRRLVRRTIHKCANFSDIKTRATLEKTKAAHLARPSSCIVDADHGRR